jgi:hypothetical protein
MASLEEVYGKDFSKKKKKSKKKLKQPLCNYYSRQYKKNSELDNQEYNVIGNDKVNNHANYNQYSKKFTGDDNKYSKKNRQEPEEQKLYIDKEDEYDYFDKLYKGHEFKSLENTDGGNLMEYQKDDDDESDEEDEPILRIDREINTDTLGEVNQYKRKRTRPLYEVGTPDYEEDKNYLDFGLYLISGVLLIFILEQFVQIGVLLKKNRKPPILEYQ